MTRCFCRVLLLCIFIAGCATGKPMMWLEKNVDLLNYNAYEIVPAVDETGKKYDFDVAGELTKVIRNSLKEKGYRVAETDEKDAVVLVLKPSLAQYEPGNALKRWVAGGYGATKCFVKCTLVDKATGKTIGEILVAKTISEGGLYSIGADTRILREVADDIVAGLETKSQ